MIIRPLDTPYSIYLRVTISIAVTVRFGVLSSVRSPPSAGGLWVFQEGPCRSRGLICRLPGYIGGLGFRDIRGV